MTSLSCYNISCFLFFVNEKSSKQNSKSSKNLSDAIAIAEIRMYIVYMNCKQTFETIFKVGFSQRRTHGNHSWEKKYIDSPGLQLTVLGEGSISFYEKSEKLKSGDLIIYNAFPKHLFSHSNEWNFYWLHIPQVLMEAYTDFSYNTIVPGVRKVHFSESELKWICMEMQDLKHLYSEKKYGWEIVAEKIVQLILTRAFLHMEQQTAHQLDITQIPGKTDFFIPGKNMEHFARECGLSRAAFFTKFRQKFGCSPLTYRNNSILTRAKAFLRTTDLRIKEISDSLFFRSPYYFTFFFMKHIHISPTEYRLKTQSKICDE